MLRDRRGLLCALATAPLITCSLFQAKPTAIDPFPEYHREVVDLLAWINAGLGSDQDNDRAMDRWGEIDRLAKSTRPTTMAGAVACLE